MLICRRGLLSNMAILGGIHSLNFRVINFDGVLKLENRGYHPKWLERNFVYH